MKLEHILLGALLERPSTGYDLKKFMDTHGRFLRSNTFRVFIWYRIAFGIIVIALALR